MSLGRKREHEACLRRRRKNLEGAGRHALTATCKLENSAIYRLISQPDIAELRAKVATQQPTTQL